MADGAPPACERCAEQPIELGCSHTICSHCGIVNESKNTIGCTRCSFTVPRPANGFAGLPPNRRMLKRAFADKAVKGEIPCDNDDCEDSATHMCTACNNKPLCTVHAGKHKQRNPSHELVQGTTVSSSTAATKDAVMCPAHPTKQPELFCHTCNVLFCGTCSGIEMHNGHNTTSAERAYSTIQASIAQSEKALRASQKHAEQVAAKMEALIAKMREQVTTMQSTVEAAAEELHRMVEAWKIRQLEMGPRTHGRNVTRVKTHHGTLYKHADHAANMADTLADYAHNMDALETLAVYSALSRGAAWHLARKIELDEAIPTDATLEMDLKLVETAMSMCGKLAPTASSAASAPSLAATPTTAPTATPTATTAPTQRSTSDARPVAAAAAASATSSMASTSDPDGQLFHALFRETAGSRKPKGTGSGNGRTIEHVLPVSLKDLFVGREAKLAIQRQLPCGPCNGSGTAESTVHECTECRGKGSEVRVRALGPGMLMPVKVTCDECRGHGKVVRTTKCRHCDGRRVIPERHVVEVHVEKGMQDSQLITFPGEGHMLPGAAPGDFVVILDQQEHPIFKRRSQDLFMVMDITVTEALCGFQRVVTHLDDRKLLLVSPPGTITPYGCVKMVPNEGMPAYRHPGVRGSLIIRFKVQFPKSGVATTAQLDLLKSVLPSVPPTPIAGTESVTLVDVDPTKLESLQPPARTGSGQDEDEDDRVRRPPQCAPQ